MSGEPAKVVQDILNLSQVCDGDSVKINYLDQHAETPDIEIFGVVREDPDGQLTLGRLLVFRREDGSIGPNIRSWSATRMVYPLPRDGWLVDVVDNSGTRWAYAYRRDQYSPWRVSNNPLFVDHKPLHSDEIVHWTKAALVPDPKVKA